MHVSCPVEWTKTRFSLEAGQPGRRFDVAHHLVAAVSDDRLRDGFQFAGLGFAQQTDTPKDRKERDRARPLIAVRNFERHAQSVFWKKGEQIAFRPDLEDDPAFRGFRDGHHIVRCAGSVFRMPSHRLDKPLHGGGTRCRRTLRRKPRRQPRRIRHAERRCRQSAAVAAKRQIGRRSKIGERLEIKMLGWMARIAVIVARITAMAANRQKAHMLARAIVMNGRRHDPIPQHPLISGWMGWIFRPACEIIGRESDGVQPGLRERCMVWLTLMGRTAERQMFRCQEKGICCTRLKQGKCLKGLHGRARIGYEIRIAPAGDDFACGIGHDGGAEMSAFNRFATPNLGKLFKRPHALSPLTLHHRLQQRTTRLTMRITDIKIETHPIASDIRNAYIDFSTMTCSLVAVVTDVVRNGKPVVGYGFNSNGRYSPTALLEDRFLPRLSKAEPAALITDDASNLDPFKIWDIMMANEKPGGHGERSVAVGVVDMAVWDAAAKIEEKPLYQLLAERYGDGTVDEKVFVYAAGGYYYPGKDYDQLKAEMKSYRDRGYRVCKMKIGGASLDEDLRRIEAALEIVGEGQNLAVDVNGRFDLKTAIAYAEALEPLNLFWYEEIGDPLDYGLQAAMAEVYKNPMATGENLFSMQDARNLIRYGGLRPDRDYLQFDCALSYGLVEYLRTIDMLKNHGWSPRRCVPHGGHQLSLNIAAGLGLGGNESYPDLFKPFGGFADGHPVEDSFVTLPEAPGIGFEAKSDLIPVMRTLAS